MFSKSVWQAGGVLCARRIGLGVELSAAQLPSVRPLIAPPQPQPRWYENQDGWALYRLPTCRRQHSILFYGYEQQDHDLLPSSESTAALLLPQIGTLRGGSVVEQYGLLQSGDTTAVVEDDALSEQGRTRPLTLQGDWQSHFAVHVSQATPRRVCELRRALERLDLHDVLIAVYDVPKL